MMDSAPVPNDTADESAVFSVIQRRHFLAAAGLAGASSSVLLPTAGHAAQPGATPGTLPGGHRGPRSELTAQDATYMREAIRLMRQAGVLDKTGGPFGAVIVLNGKIIAATGNSVLKDKDPSAHAEVNAIRQACRTVNSVDLSGAVMYTSCECCPMCYATAYWARLDKIFYAAGWKDYADLFDDLNIGVDLTKPYPERQLAPQQLLQAEAKAVWDEFRQMPNRARY